MLGVGRAAHAAVTDVPAASYVTADHAGRDAKHGRAAAEHLIVGIGCDRPWGDAEPCLHLLEPGTKIGGSESLDAEFVPPVIERRVWSAKAGRPIDRGSPADTASLKDVDRFVLGLSARRFLVELRIGLGFEHVKVRGSRQRTFLDKHDLESGTAQYFRGGAAARAGTYDGDVGVE